MIIKIMKAMIPLVTQLIIDLQDDKKLDAAEREALIVKFGLIVSELASEIIIKQSK